MIETLKRPCIGSGRTEVHDMSREGTASVGQTGAKSVTSIDVVPGASE